MKLVTNPRFNNGEFNHILIDDNGMINAVRYDNPQLNGKIILEFKNNISLKDIVKKYIRSK